MCILTYSSLLNQTDTPPQFKANHYSFNASYHKSFTLFSQAPFSIDFFSHKLSLAFKTANPPTIQSSALFFPSQPCFLSQDTLSPLFHLPFTFQSTSAWFFSLHSAEAGLTKVTNDLLSDKSHRHFPFPLWTSPQCLVLKDGTVQRIQMPALLLAVF